MPNRPTKRPGRGPGLRGFPPVAGPDASVLILGSMPGRVSLAAGQYYAHPMNAFWTVMEAVVGIPREIEYAARTTRLAAVGIALWDVIRSCRRAGSLDRSIDPLSLKPNPFAVFFATQPGIRAVFFNGRYAAALYRRVVLPGLTEPAAGLPLQVLPSTSPARADLRPEQKIAAWRIISEFL